ncbi:MAG: hypothetical protein KF841_06475 [Phycisphaerae bacterium]|nr:hypothetical protein [Phycisphaerae bacterium]
MFGRLATVRIKSAEEAIAAGNLEAALEIVTSSDLAKNERVARLREILAEKYLARGQERLLNRQFVEAIDDFARAGRCGRLVEKVIEWQRRAIAAQRADCLEIAQRDAALDEARRRADAGSLVGAAEALERVGVVDPRGGLIADSIERQTRQAEAALSAAMVAFDREDYQTAAIRIREVRKLHKGLDGLTDAENRLVDSLIERAKADFENGRLDRAKQSLAALDGFGDRRADRLDIEDQVRHATDAATALARHDYSAASVLLGRIAKLNPSATWIGEARQSVDAMEAASEAIMEGPLGPLLSVCNEQRSPLMSTAVQGPKGQPLFETLPAVDRNGVRPPPIATAAPGAVARMGREERLFAPPETPGLPRRILLRIDGVGSYLLVRGDRVSIGRGGTGATADVQLISDLPERHAEIVRAGEDYFVVSQGGVELGGAHVDHALLQPGDRVRLGKRVRLKFQRPSLKSSAATLELGEGVRMENDSRKVILWSGPVLIGGTRECHVSVNGGGADLVFMERGGRMYLKTVGSSSDAMPVELGAPMQFGNLRFTATPVAGPSDIGRVPG